MATFFKGMVHIDTINNHSTEKAFYVSINDGRFSNNRYGMLWLPKSKCIVGQANEVGWCEILVPAWIFDKNRVDYHRVLEIQWTDIVAK